MKCYTILWLFYIHLHVITLQIEWKLKPNREREGAVEVELKSVCTREVQRVRSC
jgi:hypothetical protein